LNGIKQKQPCRDAKRGAGIHEQESKKKREGEKHPCSEGCCGGTRGVWVSCSKKKEREEREQKNPESEPVVLVIRA